VMASEPLDASPASWKHGRRRSTALTCIAERGLVVYDEYGERAGHTSSLT
jgi:hypothetical protein